ncbi:unnamed protein product [Bursaphelenchus okinawaensis]|uniref:Uncharacterized protein n=1 Tax=Bursaphelenchus okinawaensis TaxID=465554 RepID=A0A811K114_9BILA|nr:unnamed protein product [Bursaphelenchus okinawaensis]CAG9088539.1 unnamed protein product [Bursaphelenchus okinawaensis]
MTLFAPVVLASRYATHIPIQMLLVSFIILCSLRIYIAVMNIRKFQKKLKACYVHPILMADEYYDNESKSKSQDGKTASQSGEVTKSAEHTSPNGSGTSGTGANSTAASSASNKSSGKLKPLTVVPLHKRTKSSSSGGTTGS